MKLTIIVDDGAVYVDGLCFSGLDMPYIPTNVHALQYKNGAGWIEFKEQAQNEPIIELPIWANAAISDWESARQKSLVKEVPFENIPVEDTLIA